MAAKVVIVGGGAMGSSIAYFLSSMPEFSGEITVIERDPSYRTASSALSASSIRQQFSTPLNIELSRFGIEFLRDAPRRLATPGDSVDLGLKENGYLILASPAGLDDLSEMHRIQRALDVNVVLLDPEGIRERFPELSTEGVAAGSLGLSDEGWFDGYGLLQAYRRKARAQGVTYVTGEVTGFDLSGAKVEAAVLADGSRIAGDILINAAGPWAGKVAAKLGIELPVRARRRMVHVFACKQDLSHLPLIADVSGVWLRPEGQQFIAGSTPKDHEPDPDDLPLEVDADDFDEVIWPAVANRVPAFEAIKSTGSWAGYYEVNTLDHNGVIGPHPDLSNMLFANGFSGHGLQHSPGVGRGLAELIALGHYSSLDLSPLSFDRIIQGKPYREINVL